MRFWIFGHDRDDDSISVKNLERMMKTDPNLEIIDLRYTRERGNNYIRCATFMPMPSLQTNIGQMDKNKFYVFCCNDGTLSKKAVRMMKYAGFTKVKWLKGGMNAWKRKHYE